MARISTQQAIFGPVKTSSVEIKYCFYFFFVAGSGKAEFYRLIKWDKAKMNSRNFVEFSQIHAF